MLFTTPAVFSIYQISLLPLGLILAIGAKTIFSNKLTVQVYKKIKIDYKPASLKSS